MGIVAKHPIIPVVLYTYLYYELFLYLSIIYHLSELLLVH